MHKELKPWRHQNAARVTTSGPSAEALARLAADRAWIEKCVADRRRERLQGSSLKTYFACVQGIIDMTTASYAA